MASILAKQALVFTCAIFACVWIAQAGDPDILSDFIVPVGTNATDGNFFTSTIFRCLDNSTSTLLLKFPTFTKASVKEFPALNGQSVSYTLLEFPVGTVNPPHTHPRASELLFVIMGSLEVGFVDTTNKLFTQTLQLGDVFVFPKGLVHYQFNADPNMPVVAVSAFGSASPGTVSLPTTLFATYIDDGILASFFKTDVATIEKLKAGLAPPKA